MNAHYAPGRAAVVVSSRVLVVVDRELAAPALLQVWNGLDADIDLAGVLGLVADATGSRLTDLPDLAIALAEEDGIRIALRGGVAVDTAGADPVSGVGVSTWVERFLPGAADVTVTTSGSRDDAVLPTGPGVVFASRVAWSPAGEPDAAASRRASARPSAPAAPAEPAPTSTPSLEREQPRRSAAPAPVPAPAPIPEPVEGSSPSAGDDTATPAPTGMIDSAAVLAAAHHDMADTLLPIDTTVGDEPEATGYDHLWGATIVRSVEDAAVRPEEESDEQGAGEQDSEQPLDAAPATLDAGDHDGATISIAQARALRAERERPPAPLAPPRLPSPARIRLSTGQVLNLDRTVVIGRRPRSTRVSGTDLPHLVAVESPQQDISRSHLEVRVDAGAIVATDLHTTNGSMLLRTGNDPVRLHPGESTVVVVGDVIDLGDGVTLTIEALS